MKWSVPKLWDGQTVAILASGPSMCQATADYILSRNLPAIVINTTFRLAPWASMIYAADSAWWLHYRKETESHSALKVTSTIEAFPELLSLKVTGYDGFDSDPSCIKSGGNSGYQCVHIALHAGAKIIELYGFDMRANGQHQHWHGMHPLTLRNHGSDIYVRWLKAYKTLVPVAQQMGVRIINRTPNSALRCFEIEEQVGEHRIASAA